MRVWRGKRTIYYDMVGTPGKREDTVVFLHSLASSSAMWMPQVAAFVREGFRVIRIDWRGHGASDEQDGEYSALELAADVEAVLDASATEKPLIVGLSLGGMIALQIAITQGQRIAGIVLCDAFSKGHRAMDDIWAARVMRAKKEGGLTWSIADSLDRWLSEEGKVQNNEMMRILSESIGETSVGGYAGCVNILQETNLDNQLQSIETPTLVICGELDQSASPEDNKMIAHHIKNAEFIELPRCKHMPNVENASTFNRVIIKWWRQHKEIVNTIMKEAQ